MSTAPARATSRRTFLRGAAAAAAVGAGGSLTACAASVDKSSSSGGGKKVKLTVMTVPGEVGADVVKAFETAHPGIALEILTYDQTKLNAMITSGNTPDLVRTAGATATPYLAQRGLAAELDSYFANSSVLKVDDLDPVNDLWRFDGAVQGRGPRYGVAKDYSQDQMYWYNAKAFEDSGVKVPTTRSPLSYDEWLDLGKRLTRRSGGQTRTYGLGAFPSSTLSHFIGMVESAGGKLFSDDLTTVDFSTPEARRVLSFYIDYANARVGSSVLEPPPASGLNPLFMADRYGMLCLGYWFGGSLYGDKVADHVGLAPAPQFGAKRVSPCYSATGYWISAKSRHKDEAWQFFEWYLGGDQAKSRASTGWGVPALKSLQAFMPRAQPAQQQALAVQRAEQRFFSAITFSPYVQIDAAEAAVVQQLTESVKGGASAGAVADALNAKLNDLLKQGKGLSGR
ncbi:extracellular solute-binding protein [Streptomyces sp. NPDC004752]